MTASRAPRSLALAGGAALLGLGLACTLPPGDAALQSANTPPAEYIGETLCRTCHVIEAEHWGDTLHAELFRGGARNEFEARGCEACHGPGSRHLQNPVDPAGLVGFTRQAGASVETQNGMCLECHSAGPRIHWAGSTHEAQDLACSDCHNPMSRTSRRGLLRERTVHETCFACHPSRRTPRSSRRETPRSVRPF